MVKGTGRSIQRSILSDIKSKDSFRINNIDIMAIDRVKFLCSFAIETGTLIASISNLLEVGQRK